MWKIVKLYRVFLHKMFFFCSQREFALIFHSKLTNSGVDCGAVLAVYNPDSNSILNLMSKFTDHRFVDSCRRRLKKIFDPIYRQRNFYSTTALVDTLPFLTLLEVSWSLFELSCQVNQLLSILHRGSQYKTINTYRHCLTLCRRDLKSCWTLMCVLYNDVRMDQ